MASEKLAPTPIDHVAVICSPALILGLVGSLVFFLLEILYTSEGPWRFRLQWILFFYVFGIVLVARISMNGETAQRASLYGLILTVLAYMGMQSFVEYPGPIRAWSFLANLVMIAVVWWVTYGLVWDCTNIDDDVESSAEGLLQATRIDAGPMDPITEHDEKGRPLSFLERWRRFSAKAREGRTLGGWVVYLSLAAMPIFGLGQALLPLSVPERRVWAFQLMAIYLVSGLGLLLTTCFLGLRRYLRQRRLQMPASMTVGWLTSGGGLLVGLIVVAALLPRPYSENALVSDWKLTSKKREASNFSPNSDSPAEGKGSRGESKDHKGEASNKGGKNPDPLKAGKDEKNKIVSDAKAAKDKDGNKSDQRPSDDKTSPPSRSWEWTHWQAFLAPWLKAAVFIAMAVAVVLLVLRQGLAFFANFSEWAKRWLAWWDAFFMGSKDQAVITDEPIEADANIPFSAYENPYRSGRAATSTPRWLVRYSFAALEALARERSEDRKDHETAQEFVNRLADEYPDLQSESRALLHLYTLAEYARDEAPADVHATLRTFWERIDRASSRVCS